VPYVTIQCAGWFRYAVHNIALVCYHLGNRFPTPPPPKPSHTSPAMITTEPNPLAHPLRCTHRTRLHPTRLPDPPNRGAPSGPRRQPLALSDPGNNQPRWRAAENRLGVVLTCNTRTRLVCSDVGARILRRHPAAVTITCRNA
jgi:hypothetical protein